jgi:RNA polymerase sigma-70 factor (ECF subfamily)
LDLQPNEGIAASSSGIDPEDETLLAEAVGIALLVVLERLAPAERVAFVLHDVFAVSFDDIAAVVKRTPAAARQLASRARRRVRGTTTVSGADLSEQRAAVEQFLAALRTRDLDALLAVLDPDVVRRADSTAVAPGAARELRGAATVIEEALKHTDTAKFARPVLVNESVGIVVAPRGHVRVVIRCTVKGGKITEMNVIADPTRISKLNLALLEN